VKVEDFSMAFCKSCGTEIGDAKFCPACGTAQDIAPAAEPVSEPAAEPAAAPIFAEPIAAAPVFTPEPSSYNTAGGTSGADASQVPPVYTAPAYTPTPAAMPSTTGQMVFSIINIVLGVLLCCCYGVSLVSLVMGIIALVFTNQANKASSPEEAKQKLKSAMIMNIIGVACLVLAIIITGIVMAVSGTSTWQDAMESAGYNY